MRRTRLWLGTAAVVFLSSALAQQPAPPPALPPIAPNLARLDQTLNGLDGPGRALALGDDAGILVAACEEGTVQCWGKDVAMGVRAGSGTPPVRRGQQAPVLALAWRGGPVLASAGADGKVLLWEMPAGKVLHTLTPGGTVRSLAVSPDGKVLATGGDDAAVQLWDVAA